MMETKRLCLRPFEEGDIADVYEYAKVADIGNGAGWKPHESIQESAFIVTQIFMQNKEETTYAIVDKESNHVIGSIGYRKDPCRPSNAGCVGIGYVLAKPYWGKGLMMEAMEALLKYLFEELDYSMVSISHDHDNRRSQRVIEKCGFVYEGKLRNAAIYDWIPAVKDRNIYSMTKAEYEAKWRTQ